MAGFDAVILGGVEVDLYDSVKEELLASLKQVAAECGEDVTFLEFCRWTGTSYRTVQKKFGTWADLREAVGLPRIARIHREARHQNDEIVHILQEMAGEQGDRISLDEFARATGISGSNIHRLFGEPFEVHTVMSKVVPSQSRKRLAEFRGGMMFELGCHVIDLVVGVLGKPTEVTSFRQHSSKLDDHLADNMLSPTSTAT